MNTLNIEYEAFMWLLKEALIFAVQDQSLKMRNYQAAVMKTIPVAAVNCRMCHHSYATIDYIIVSACPFLAETAYITRHNSVLCYIHHCVCRAVGIPVSVSHYQHQLVPVVENDKVKILWEFTVPTDFPSPPIGQTSSL